MWATELTGSSPASTPESARAALSLKPCARPTTHTCNECQNVATIRKTARSGRSGAGLRLRSSGLKPQVTGLRRRICGSYVSPREEHPYVLIQFSLDWSDFRGDPTGQLAGSPAPDIPVNPSAGAFSAAGRGTGWDFAIGPSSNSTAPMDEGCVEQTAPLVDDLGKGRTRFVCWNDDELS